MEPREYFLAEARSKATALTILVALVAALLWYLYATGDDGFLTRLALAGAVIATAISAVGMAVGWLAALAAIVIRHTPVQKSERRP